MRKLATLLLAVVFASAALAQTEHHGVAKYGTLGAPQVVGHRITVTDEATSDVNRVDLYCPITAYGSDSVGTYWRCGGGYLLVNGVWRTVVADGKMSKSCWSENAGDKIPNCLYSFEGRTSEGPLLFSARGDQYTGTVYYFDGVW